MVKFLIVVSGWNCQKYVKACFDSIKSQTYKNYDVLAINDGSTDGTLDLVTKERDWNWTVRTMLENVGTVKAKDFAIKRYDQPYDIIVWLDMDDQLMSHALETVARYYDDNTWLTYGNYIDNFDRTFFNEQTLKFDSDNFRQEPWKFIHLRTFRKELYYQLTDEDLFTKHKAYPDANMLYKLLELAKGHIKPVHEIIYRYTCNNPMCVTYRFTQEQRDEELKDIQGCQK
jgi:glycosyltransferase involved in cell wall biosynthesis